jgi:hypothetical protein
MILALRLLPQSKGIFEKTKKKGRLSRNGKTASIAFQFFSRPDSLSDFANFRQ